MGASEYIMLTASALSLAAAVLGSLISDHFYNKRKITTVKVNNKEVQLEGYSEEELLSLIKSLNKSLKKS